MPCTRAVKLCVCACRLPLDSLWLICSVVRSFYRPVPVLGNRWWRNKDPNCWKSRAQRMSLYNSFRTNSEYTRKKCSSERRLPSILGITILRSKSSPRSTVTAQYRVYWVTYLMEMSALCLSHILYGLMEISRKKMARKWRWRKFSDSWQWTVIVTRN